MSQPSVSPLRQRMLEDMAMRGLRTDTQRDYVRFVSSFAAFLRRSPDTATGEDIRRFQVSQAAGGMQPPSINASVSALRFPSPLRSIATTYRDGWSSFATPASSRTS